MKRTSVLLWFPAALAAGAIAGVGCTARVTTTADTKVNRSPQELPNMQDFTTNRSTPRTDLATFGSGCFWCVEAVFQQLEGVTKVESGYSGGHVQNPTYREVCEGDTGHAEVCQITYDPAKVTFDELLEAFWKSHDPTTPNQQGHDIGPQYRSVIYFHNEQQRELAVAYKQKLDSAGVFDAPIVTEISPFATFFRAEDYHQNYFLSNPGDRYCRAVIQPKVDKFRQVFSTRLKSEEK